MNEPNPFAGLPERLQGFAGLQAEIDAAGMGDPVKRERDELRARVERLEAIVVLLCQEASRGQGSMGKPFWQFIDDWRHEHEVPT